MASTLAAQPPRAFDDPDALAQLERRVQQQLADAWTGTAEAPTYNFVDCALVVDELVTDEPVDGDVP